MLNDLNYCHQTDFLGVHFCFFPLASPKGLECSTYFQKELVNLVIGLQLRTSAHQSHIYSIIFSKSAKTSCSIVFIFNRFWMSVRVVDSGEPWTIFWQHWISSNLRRRIVLRISCIPCLKIEKEILGLYCISIVSI